MYPTFEIFDATFHVFGIILSVCWLLFFILLHHFSLERGIIRPVFIDILTFTASMFFFARVFHILGDWLNEKFILMELTDGKILSFLKLFFTPQNYYFSLFWAIVWFFLVFLIKTHSSKKERPRYIDAIVPAFLTTLIPGYIWAFLWWQVYGIPYAWVFSVSYHHADSIVKDKAELFPLALIYAAFCLWICIGIKKWSQWKTHPDGFIWYLWIASFSFLLLIGEFFSGWRKDIFYDYFGLWLNQIWALCGLIFATLWILRIIGKKVF